MKKIQKILAAVMKVLSQQEPQWVVVYSNEMRCFLCHELSLEVHQNVTRLAEMFNGTRKNMPDWTLMGLFETRMEASLYMAELYEELYHVIERRFSEELANA